MSGFNVSGIISLKDAFSAVATRVSVSATRLRTQLVGLQAQSASMAASSSKVAAGAGLMAVAMHPATMAIAAVGYAMVKTIQSYASHEDAMAGLRKTANLSRTEMDAMMQSMLNLSKVTRTSAIDLMKLGETGAQLGVAKKDLIGFVEHVNKIGVSFDITAEKAAASVGKIKNAMGMTLNETYALHDAMNALGNSTGASSDEISRSVMIFGATAKMMNMQGTEAAALAATLIETGRAPEMVGRGLNSILPTLGTIASASEEAQGWIAKMGFDPLKLQAEAIQNPVNALLNVLSAMAKLSPSDQLVAGKGIFGQQWLDEVMILVNEINKLISNLNLVSTKDQFEGSVLQEYANKMDTLSAKWDMLGNKAIAVGVKLGGALKPVAEFTIAMLSHMLEVINSIIDAIGSMFSMLGNAGSSIGGFFSGIGNFLGVTGTQPPATVAQSAANAQQVGVGGQSVNVQVGGAVDIRQDGRIVGRAPITKVGTNGAGRASTGGDVGITSYGY